MDNINALAQKHMDILVNAAMSPGDKTLHKEATKLHGVGECLKYIFTLGIKDSGEKRLKSVINSLSRSLASENISPRKTLNSIIDNSDSNMSIRFTIDESEKSLQGEYELCITKDTDGAYSLKISEENVSEPLELQLSEAQFISGARYFNTIYFLDEYNLSEARQKYIDTGYLDLSGEDLSGRDMSDLDLSNADLSGANLSRTSIEAEQLLGTSLIRDNFSEDNQLEAAKKLSEIMLLETNNFNNNDKLFESTKNMAKPECQHNQLDAAEKLSKMLSGVMLSETNDFDRSSKDGKLFESIKHMAKPECQQLFNKTLEEHGVFMMDSYSIAGNIILMIQSFTEQ
ncbi:pentapeptide repeat-containing protein [Citrobacter sp. RHBSTW-00271]|uniref:pentapeptide repeat-containing protein n=1 Tax=Citrobacter sp. RHBSTW-00271 TaxID=2742642 RepID=UPI002017F4FD|nr:pentapeptide repeat-containing protein [Citrobacter sp. RHBSTW-00271]